MAGTYFGKVCTLHPELKGERNLNVRRCSQCHRDKKREWAKTNRNRDRTMSLVYSRLRKQKITQAIPPWADLDKIKAIYDSRRPGEHVDHVVPLKGIDPETGKHVVCGLHVHNNLEVRPAADNGSKWAYWVASR